MSRTRMSLLIVALLTVPLTVGAMQPDAAQPSTTQPGTTQPDETQPKEKIVGIQITGDPTKEGEVVTYAKTVETETDGVKTHTTVEIDAAQYAEAEKAMLAEIEAPQVPPSPGDKLLMLAQPQLMGLVAEGKFVPVMLLREHGEKPEFQAATGISPEQVATMEAYSESLEEKDFIGPIEELEKRAAETEDPDELAALTDQAVAVMRGVVDKFDEKLRETVTPEQMLRLRELELQADVFGDEEFLLVNFGGYEALELTEEQRKQFDALREEYLADVKDELALLMGATDRELDEEEEKALTEKLQKRTALVKAKILALLTPEQAKKFERLMANRPAFLDAPGTASDAAVPENDEWKKSWKPGDPVPEGYEAPQPKGGFPFRPL